MQNFRHAVNHYSAVSSLTFRKAMSESLSCRVVWDTLIDNNDWKNKVNCFPRGIARRLTFFCVACESSEISWLGGGGPMEAKSALGAH